MSEFNDPSCPERATPEGHGRGLARGDKVADDSPRPLSGIEPSLAPARIDDVACIVVHHDHYPGVLETIDDLIGAGLPATSILVVDNSSDRMLHVDMAERVAPTRVLRVDNRGYGAAVNDGLKELDTTGVGGRFLLVCTHEVRFDKDALRKLRDALSHFPTAAVAGPTLYTTGSLGVWSTGGRLTRVLRLPKHNTRVVERELRSEHRAVVERDWLDGALCLYDRAMLRENPPREDFFLYFEETELHCRIRKLGRTVVWVPAASATQSTSGVPAWLLGRNLHLFLRLHGNPIGRRIGVQWTLLRRFFRTIATGSGRTDLELAYRGWRAAVRDGFEAPFDGT